MGPTASRKNRQSAPTVRTGRIGLIDSLEPRVLLAADAETRWMIAAGGGNPGPQAPLTVTENLPDQNGYPRTTDPAALVLSGTASSGMFVKVNGVQATPSPAPEGWSLANTNNVLGLSPGINRVQVRSYNNAGQELVRKTLDIWYDDGNMQAVSGTLAGNNTWTAANGPYHVTADLTVPAGATLTIEPGTSVYVAGNAKIVINGRLLANGTDFKHVRFTRLPTAANDWADLEFRSTQQDNRLSYVDYEYARAQPAGSTIDQGLRVDASKIFLDHVHFANIGRMYVDMTNASIDIRKSIFPGMTAAVEPLHYSTFPANGFAVMDGNIFGPAAGYNDIIDFTGGQRPGPVAQFLNNWFLGGTDDGLDMDSTDAWIEGNVFMHFHQDGNRESKSHAVSTGNDTGQTSEITVVRNFFYDVDHAALIKSGAYGTFVNNTIVNVHTPNPAINATTAVINFHEVRSGQWQGRGATLEGNVIQSVSRLFELPTPFPAGHPETVQITVDHSILPTGSGTALAGANVTFGPGVKFGDPMLVNTTNVIDPTNDFGLRFGSPAEKTGPNGVDMGALVPHGVSLSGPPILLTNNNDQTLNVGFLYGTGTNAAGYTHYKYRVNDSAWSAETPTTTPITLTDLADGAHTVRAIGKNDAGFWQDESTAASRILIIDTVAPKVTGTTFHLDGRTHGIVVDFNDEIEFNLAQADPRLRNLVTGEIIRGDDILWTPGADDISATIVFPNLPNARLPDGRYELILNAAGLRDQAGNALDGDADGTPGGDYVSSPTFFKTGDINHDAVVDFNDLAILAQNYNTTGKTFAQGNLDYDEAGNVDFNDLAILAQNYNTALPEAPAGTEPAHAVSEESAAPVFSTSPVVRPKAKAPAKKLAVRTRK